MKEADFSRLRFETTAFRRFEPSLMCHLYFDSVEAFQSAFGSHVETILGDKSNYTDVQPTIQISEVKI
jgi:uncharacterized protein (TIGR02118 family)